MPVDHKEIAFEAAIEESLLTKGGYLAGDPLAFDRELALDRTELFAFLRDSQPKAWAKLEGLLGAQTDSTVLDNLLGALAGRGSLDVLRHGFKCYGKQLSLAYFAPAHGMNPETQALYESNRLTVTRQLRYSLANDNSIDLVIGLNGLPVVTAELKNPMSGQTWRDAVWQYKVDRDPAELIFRFKLRSLVHFALDPDEVYMTTRLALKATSFLPFNKGDGTAAGNPVNPDGYKTAYLWEQVLARDSLMDILARFLHLEVDERKLGPKTVRRETMIFPRYHQLDCVRKAEADARAQGAGRNYLIQHSAGSGKSNSIAWLAHRLATLHTRDDRKVFDSVVVVTDRRVLDKQLQDTIYQFEHKQGVVEKIDENSTQLAEALEAGTAIVITTMQKFPFVTEKIGQLPKRRYAVIVDEAHSSQSGESASKMKTVLAGAQLAEQAAEEVAEDDSLDDYQEEVIKAMAARGRQPNLSFFGFTATPKYKTLEVFGRPGPDGKPEPFHLYSMRQAIEEGFILDVLAHYTTYKTYYGLIKSAQDDPEVEKKQAAKALARYMSLHPYNLAQKTEVMLEHFRTHTRHKIGGRAKAMVVTGSRLHAVRYKQEFDRQLAEKGYSDIKALVAFSGEVIDPDIAGATFTEVAMNQGIKEKQLPEKFAGDDYQLLLVAEKYQTGFDQPLLHTMYVDKRLAGVQAVQTLSRLNRTAPGKEDTFVLDFVNEPEEIYLAFAPYYEVTAVGEQASAEQLYALQAELNGAQIYYQEEVEGFCGVFFAPKATQSLGDHAKLNAWLDKAVTRYVERHAGEHGQEECEEFRGKLVAFRNLYAFLSQIIPYGDSDLEKLYSFVRFLIPKLPRRASGPQYHFDDEVSLKYYRLQKISEGAIPLQPDQPGLLDGPTEVGSGLVADEKVALSTLVELINQRFGTSFTEADELFFSQIREEAAADEQLQQAATANALEGFKIVFDKALEGLFIGRMEQNEAITAKFLDDKEFRGSVSRYLLKQVYEQIRGEALAV
jgi:type I restriction enzyme R subunit